MMMAEDFSSCLSPKLSFPLFTIFIYSLAVSSSFTGWEGREEGMQKSEMTVTA
jgi:hypothetical protein